VIHGTQLLLTSVERAQGLTVAMASALVFSTVSLELWCGRRRAAGLSPAMARGGTAAAALRERREKGEARATEWMGVFWGRGSVSRPGGGGGRPRRAHRRRTAATWPSLAGTRRASARGREWEGEAGWAAGWAEREAGLAQQRLPLFHCFLNFFSQTPF